MTLLSPVGILLLLGVTQTVHGGCRWYNPQWLQSLDSAPQVEISVSKIVTVTWSKEQFEDKFDCADKFEVGVENSAVEGERRLCSLNKTPGYFAYQVLLLLIIGPFRKDEFNCKLDLSSKSHCGQRFGFWVTAVNLNHNRGVERIRSYANSVVDIKCEGESLTKKVRL